MKKLFAVIMLLNFLIAKSQEINIIPKPAEVKMKSGFFLFDKNVLLVANGGHESELNVINLFNGYLQRFCGFQLKVSKFRDEKEKRKQIIFGVIPKGFDDRRADYILEVDKSKIRIIAPISKTENLFYGSQSLLQLLPTGSFTSAKIPCCTINDYPRFAYRGLHFDVSRHFFPVDYIKKYIDYIALHKMNYFHWHLTDDQGWRIEIKKYPKLTSVGGWRNGTIIGRYPGTGNDGIKYGGFYTQEQIKEIVKYAADRYITVVPEIEMPGHSSAAIAAYPELSCFPKEPTINYFPKQCVWSGDSTGKQVQQTWGVFDDVFCAGQENTFKFLEDVMDEVLALFPSKYIHVGGDECPKENWKRCTHCQQRMKDNKLKDEHELQSYFIQRMEKYLNKKGRTLIGWDEILEGGLAPNAVVMSWRGEKGGIDAAKESHDVIMTPGNPVYFDHTQSENEDSVTIGGYNPIEKVYAYEPIPKELNAEQAKYVLGAQANVWTEYMGNEKKVEYMIFPRMAALSEILWSQREKRDWNSFEKRLPEQIKRYEMWGANYSNAYYDLKGTVLPTHDYHGVLWKVENKSNIPFGINVNQNDTVWRYTEPQLIKSTSTYYASGKNKTLVQKFSFNKATGKKITLTNEASKSYPGDGAFTLVNGVQNVKGMARSKEFLGFSGTDCVATIDLGKPEKISQVVIYSLKQEGSWIWRPLAVEVFSISDDSTFTSLGLTDDFVATNSANGTMTINFIPTTTRFVVIKIKNWGIIPAGNPGAGNKAWLFVDEIEVN
jgi:hexosaminidase